MQFNYNIQGPDFSNAIDIYQRGQTNKLAQQQAQQASAQQQQVQELAKRAMAGDKQALNELGGIDQKAAGDVIALQKAQQPAKPTQVDFSALGGELSQIKALAANGSPMLGSALQNLASKYQGTGFETEIASWGQKYQQDPQAAMQELDASVNAFSEPKEDATRLDFLKEERSVARDEVKGFNKRIQEIRGSYGKIESLLSKENPTRADISAAITSMARLVSPGIVTEQDFQSLTGSGAPLPTIIAELRGLGQEGVALADALNQSIDPTNPEFFNKTAFLDTAKNVAGAEVPALIDSYEQARARAKRAGIAEDRINAVFGENKNYKFATGFSAQPSKNIVGAKSPTLGRNVTKEDYDTLTKAGLSESVIRQRLGI